jgi:hypothetical protein
MATVIFATKDTPGAVLVSVRDIREKRQAVDKKKDTVLTVVHVNYCPFPPELPAYARGG